MQLGGPVDHQEEDGGHHEARGIREEGGIAPERRREHTTERRAEREHHTPCAAGDRVGRAQVVLVVDQVRYRRGRCGPDEGRECGDHTLEEERRPDMPLVDRQQAECGDRLPQGHENEDLPPVETVH